MGYESQGMTTATPLPSLLIRTLFFSVGAGAGVISRLEARLEKRGRRSSSSGNAKSVPVAVPRRLVDGLGRR